MARLSANAAALFRDAHPHVHALTDITGFALVGHAHEMAHLSKLTLRFTVDALPILPGTEGYAKAGLITGGGARNQEYYGKFVTSTRPLERWQAELVYDPQTSGRCSRPSILRMRQTRRRVSGCRRACVGRRSRGGWC
jgi:selenide,water dikinase